MPYFDYHSRIKSLIRAGELKSYHFDDNYKKIGFALVLSFDKKSYPVREDHFFEYFDLIGEYYQTKKVGKNFETLFLKTSK